MGKRKERGRENMRRERKEEKKHGTQMKRGKEI